MNKIVISLFLIIFIGLQSCFFMRITDKQAQKKFSEKNLTLKFCNIYVNKVRLHYVKIGCDTLPSLFFIHGTPGSWNGYLQYLMDSDLRSHFRIISIDRPGFGFSGSKKAFHLKDQSRLIYEIVKQESNAKPLHLIGHSLGGPIVIRLAEDHPDAYASLTILAGSISPYEEPKEKWRSIFVNNPLQYLIIQPLRNTNTEIWYFKKELFVSDSSYDKLTMPITIIHGDKDNLVSVKNTDYARKKLAFNPKLNIMIIPNASHLIPWEHYDIVKKHLLGLSLN